MDVALTEILVLDALAGLSGQITDILPALGFFPLCGMWKRPCFLRLFRRNCIPSSLPPLLAPLFVLDTNVQ